MNFLELIKKFKYIIYTNFQRFKWNTIYGNSRYIGQKVLLGRRVNISNNVVTGNHGYIGQYSYIGPNTTIGCYFVISDNVNIIGHDHEYQIARTPILNAGLPLEQPETIIGHDVWLGHGVVIMRGCVIGDGAIIAACSVVTKNVEPFTIYAGVPARKVKERFKSTKQQEIHKDFISMIDTNK